MTKQDFELIARTIRDLDGGLDWTDKRRERIASAFADALATTNPRFDKARFIEAATLTYS